MEKRTREIVLRVPVTPEERALIQQKMAQLHTKNFSAYARKMLIDGYIVHMDTSDIRAQTAELQKIGVNVNQIARRINSTGTVYAQDVEDIKGALNSTASRYFLKLRIFVVFSFRQSKTNSICPLSSFISLAFTNSAG
ncbi:plasmid mobilization relaxosome protein MobC [Clostridioides difficile]|nr:plasmid mobilization relaxosome protein MobC [Clostridioides difficile]EGT5089539.1 plasmid mobilization relaxosome protein MobC [Clostridioides difficile]EGT5494139.1 plasmid mobilization relaxosome protein MobC [Clostridioides difficile]EJX3386134.1 plasmid mobilization relaxosome protein MobC [Clostridioides difficile]EJX3386585.1 plasmid mobilization relaxosome protein MobC [Clostridioides difficile]